MRKANVVVAVFAILLSSCNSPAQDSSPVPTPVRVEEATAGPAVPTIRTNGVLVNRDEVRLAFKVGGVVKRIDVNAGDRVRRGQRLAEIEQTEIAAQVDQARQTYDKTQRDVQRGERLYADKVISLEQLQDLRTQGALAEATLKSAQFNSEYAVIVSPHDGTILRRLAEERELIAAGAPVLVLGSSDRGFVVRAGLADREIVQVEPGDAAEIRLDALPHQILRGTITQVAGASETLSSLFTIEVSIDASDAPLKSGLVAKLTISPAAAKQGSRVYVPISAIVEGDKDRASVFVLHDNRAKRREVEVAFIAGEQVALLSGVDVGERVITDGALYLEDGEHVSVQQNQKRIANSKKGVGGRG